MEALENNDFATVAEICLLYYDKAYLLGLRAREQHQIKLIEVTAFDENTLLATIVAEADKTIK